VTEAENSGVGARQKPGTHAAAPAEPILRLRGVGRRFGGVQAVRDVDLDVAYGERRAILGPNGAGKTTLFNLVAGDFNPSAGTIEVMGEDITFLPSRVRPKLGLARTYQKTRLFPGLTVEDNIFLAIVGHDGGRMRLIRSGRDRAVRARAREAAERVWLGHKADVAVRDLSHGEQRQLEVGMASAVEPRLMMLDEPASGLSRGERERLTELLTSLPADVTLILIEHDMDVALTVAQYVTMMHDGRKVVEGTPAEIRGNQMVHDIYLGSRFHEEHE
jgi:branched-chain amino acid transport system ATP-binding protein